MLEELFKKAIDLAERQNTYNITKDMVVEIADNLGYQVNTTPQ